MNWKFWKKNEYSLSQEGFNIGCEIMLDINSHPEMPNKAKIVVLIFLKNILEKTGANELVEGLEYDGVIPIDKMMDAKKSLVDLCQKAIDQLSSL